MYQLNWIWSYLKNLKSIQTYCLELSEVKYMKINEWTAATLSKIYTLMTFVTERNDAQVQIMVGTLVLDLESHLIVFKVAICMHKLKYWFLLQVYPLTNTRILYFLLNDSLLICMMIVTRRTSSWMLNKGREHYLLSIQEGNLVLVVWSSIYSNQKRLFNFFLIFLYTT